MWLFLFVLKTNRFIIVAIVFEFAQAAHPMTGWLLIAARALLLLFRFLELNDNDSFFFDSEDDFTYIEIPLGFIAGLIAGIKNLRSS